MSKITVKADQMRCVWFTAQNTETGPSGQQCSQWLPKGDYTMIAREQITLSTLNKGVVKDVFVRLHKAEQVLYVHPNFLKGVDWELLPVIPSV